MKKIMKGTEVILKIVSFVGKVILLWLAGILLTKSKLNFIDNIFIYNSILSQGLIIAITYPFDNKKNNITILRKKQKDLWQAKQRNKMNITKIYLALLISIFIQQQLNANFLSTTISAAAGIGASTLINRHQLLPIKDYIAQNSPVVVDFVNEHAKQLNIDLSGKLKELSQELINASPFLTRLVAFYCVYRGLKYCLD